MSPRGPFLFRTDSVSNLLQAWARLGPLSLFRAFRPVTDRRLIATVPPRSLAQWGGMAIHHERDRICDGFAEPGNDRSSGGESGDRCDAARVEELKSVCVIASELAG